MEKLSAVDKDEILEYDEVIEEIKDEATMAIDLVSFEWWMSQATGTGNEEIVNYEELTEEIKNEGNDKKRVVQRREGAPALHEAQRHETLHVERHSAVDKDEIL